MSVYDYKTIVDRAKTVKKNVEEKQEVGVNTRWSYYFAKSILSPKKDITQISFTEASKSTGDTFKDVKIELDKYKDMATRLAKYVNEKKTLPNFITINNKKMNVNDYTYMFARIIVFYDKNNQLPNYAMVNSSSFTKKTTKKSTTKTTTSSNSNCNNPYTSTPHYTTQGVSKLGQINGSNCGPHTLRQCFKKFGWDISESTLASVAGTVIGSGTGHNGLNTAIAWVSKKKGVKLTVEWKNFSDFGKNKNARFKAIGELACKPNKAVFFHIGYEDSGSSRGSTVFGHYEMCDKYNIKTNYVRALNSLGSRSGNGYIGHLQDRSFSLQEHYINNISQKSVCIITKA